MAEGLVPRASQPAPLSPSYGSEYGAPAPAVNQLERPLAAVRRYKWLVLSVSILAAVAGYVVTRFMAPEYQVRATVWLQTESDARPGNNRAGPIRSAELLSSSPAWIELFRSYRIVDAVVRKLSLYLTPANGSDAPVFAGFALTQRFLPGGFELTIDRSRKTWLLRTESGIEVERGASGDSVGAKAGFQWKLADSVFNGTGERKIRFTVATPRETSVELLERVGNRLAERSNFLWLTYSDRSAHMAERTLNTWLDEYVQVAADLKKRNMVEFANILQEQVRYAEKATQDAETAYQSFRVNTITLPTESGPVAAGAGGVGMERDPAVQSFFEQKIQYDNLRHDREALEKSLTNGLSGKTPYEGLLLIPSVAQSPGAEALREAFKSLYETQARLRVERQNYTDEFPAVKQLIASVEVLQQQTIPSLANQLLVQLRDREADYQRRIQGASRELQQIPPRTIEEMRLHRAVVVAEGLYTNLKNRYAEARLAEASATPDVSVLDTAVAPLTPNKNRAGIVFLMVIAGGLGVAIGLALLLDRLDGKLRYSEQAGDLGLIIAGAVPRVPKGGISATQPEQAVQFIEAFRTLRMHVMHSTPGKQVTLAVTSPAPGDGKSLVASNLALSFADAGLRTVLVDGDTRRGTLHRLFDLKPQDGLTEYLVGAIDERQAARATSHANLWLIPCGRRHAKSPELLATPRIKTLVEKLGETYDVVIFDTPPMAAGIDGYAISAAAGSVLMVLRLDVTERRLAAKKLAVMDRLPVEFVGAVLNGVPLTGEFRYYSYSSGYALTANDSSGNDLMPLSAD
jgi:capsular exopolysaccharide synthesis family protein